MPFDEIRVLGELYIGFVLGSWFFIRYIWLTKTSNWYKPRDVIDKQNRKQVKLTIDKMEKLIFELTNEQRKYLGLKPIENNWELIKLFNSYVYFDGDIIRKEITVDQQKYNERDINEKTSENRTILLPKTSKGKPKKLNFTATQSFKGTGVYFLSLIIILPFRTIQLKQLIIQKILKLKNLTT